MRAVSPVPWPAFAPALAPDRPAPAHPVALTGDPDLRAALLAAADSAGVEIDLVDQVTGLTGRWERSPVVVVGADLVAQAVGEVPAPRAGVVVVTGGKADADELWRQAVTLGAEQVVRLPEAAAWLVRRLAAHQGGCPTRGMSGAGLVGVVGGRGGAGASSLAVALAVTGRRRGLTVALVDLDPLGGGIDLALGAEHEPGARWSDLAGARGQVSAEALRSALPVAEGVAVLASSRVLADEPAAEAVMAVLRAARAGHDLVVVDLPRASAPSRRAAVAACDRILLVVPAEVRAVAAAASVVAALRDHPDVGVVVRTGGTGALHAQMVAEALGLPLAGQIRPEPGLAAALDRGDPPGSRRRGPLAGLCRALLDSWLDPRVA